MPQERAITVEGHEYAVGRLDAFQQLHVASQWRNMILGLAFAKKNRAADTTDDQYRTALLVIVTGGVGDITTQSREEVTRLCLSAVSRKSGQGWSKILAPTGEMMFQDIQLPQLVELLYEALDHSGIVDFFSGGLSDLQGPKTAT